MSPVRQWPVRQFLACATIVLALPLGASLAAPNVEGGGNQGPRQGGKGQTQGLQGGKRDGERGKHKPILIEVVEFLRAEGVTDISGLSEDRRAELSQAFRDAKGKEHMTARIRTLVDVLVVEGITTPAQIEAMSDDQRQSIMDTVREKMEADRPPMGGPGGGPGGPGQGPGGGGRQGGTGGGPGGQGNGGPGGGDMLLDHFANMLTEAGISDISNLSDSQIASLIPKPGDRKGGPDRGEGPMQGQGNKQGKGPKQGQGPGGQGKGQKGQRQGNGPGQGSGGRGQGPGGQGQGQRGEGPRMDPVGMVLDFLSDQGIDSIADLSAGQLEELQMTWHESMRPEDRPKAERAN